MTRSADIRCALAEVIAARTGLTACATPPADPTRDLVWVEPQPDTYIDAQATGATFRAPGLMLRAILTSAMVPYADALTWVDQITIAALEAVRADPKLGGRCGGVAVSSVSPPSRLLRTDGQTFLLAVEIRFTPILVTIV